MAALSDKTSTRGNDAPNAPKEALMEISLALVAVITGCFGIVAIAAVVVLVIVTTRDKSRISIEWVNKLLGTLKLNAENDDIDKK
ncbi:hypothetical protein ABT294_50130 [Nonomuraea sp. NPDC000554]|uniref:hypothetical protein n=1 Tax=Nonomuraea sp. NPDC000554 TaxID=3154259 RepID=UPI00331FFA82